MTHEFLRLTHPPAPFSILISRPIASCLGRCHTRQLIVVPLSHSHLLCICHPYLGIYPVSISSSIHLCQLLYGSSWCLDLYSFNFFLYRLLCCVSCCYMASYRAGVECDVSCRSVAAGLISLARKVGRLNVVVCNPGLLYAGSERLNDDSSDVAQSRIRSCRPRSCILRAVSGSWVQAISHFHSIDNNE
jgi:hypothetical protein